MDKRKLGIALSVAIAVVLVVGIALALIFFVFVGGRAYPRNAPALDLRDQALSAEDFDRVQEKLPGTYILWNIPFQNGSLSSGEKELKVTSLTDGDVEVLDYALGLETVDGWECDDYVQLARLQQRHPNAQVQFALNISGVNCNWQTKRITVDGLTDEDAEKLCSLSHLEQVRISGCTDYALLRQLQQDHPQWDMTYTVTFGDEEFAYDEAQIRGVDATYEQITGALETMPNLTKLELVNPRAEGEALVALQADYREKGVDITWQVELYGQTVSSDATELDISGAAVKSCEEVEQAVQCLPKLEKLIMSDCGIDSKTMAAFRERQRENYKVVWTVHLSSKCKARTDDTYFMPIQQGEYYFLDKHSEELKYCEDMVCIDLGHHKIHNIDFVAYMPKLKYLILAHTEVQDVSPIVNCQELVYLEVDWSTIRSYEPIAQLKKLEDLNLNQTYCDITPILSMTWLKNLWAPGRSGSVQLKLLEALPDTHVQLQDKNPAGQGWRNLDNYYAMRDYLGMYYME